MSSCLCARSQACKLAKQTTPLPDAVSVLAADDDTLLFPFRSRLCLRDALPASYRSACQGLHDTQPFKAAAGE